MRKEMNQEYYDNIFKTAPQYSLSVDADHSWHSDLYAFVINLFNENDRILELGCGTGQFAEKVINAGFDYALGLDFAIEGINLCKKRCPLNNFRCEDLYISSFHNIEYTTILSLETMEHIENDLEILNKIAKGRRVIISLPSFDDVAHVRFFTTSQDVIDRYFNSFNQMFVHIVNRYFVIDALK